MICPTFKKCLWISSFVILLALNLDLLLFNYNNGTFIFPQKVVLFLNNNFNKNITRQPPIKKFSFNFSKSSSENSLNENSLNEISSNENSSNSVAISNLSEAFKISSKFFFFLIYYQEDQLFRHFNQLNVL